MTDLKSRDEWNGSKLTFAQVMQISASLMEDSIKKQVAEAAAEMQLPDLMKHVCDEHAEGLARATRLHRMLPQEVTVIIKTPGEHGTADPFYGSATSIGAKVRALATDKPEDYMLYVTSVCNTALRDNVLLTERVKAKNGLLNRLRAEIGPERFAEITGDSGAFEYWEED